ncbi:MAG: auxin efflux carrier family protein [Ponticaulis sp.]|nr:auxin efflux carrier family protein [Ponticaulis sp.]
MNFIQALIPVIALVAFGRFLSWRNIPSVDGWRAIERLCYLVFFPALIILVLSRAPLETAPWKIALTLVIAQVILAAIGLFSILIPGTERPRVGCIIQSNSRWNTFIALTISGVLFGEEGLALTAICAAVMIPLANILSVLALSHFGKLEDGPKRNPFAELIRNPLVIACIIGGALNILGLKPEGVIETTIDLVASPAMTLGLLAAGAGIDFTALKRAGFPTIFWSVTRLIGLPLIAVPLAYFGFGIAGAPLLVLAIATSTPTATNGYVLARQLGGDAPFMANLIATQTVLASLTMALVYFVTLHLTALS